jgi:hypothetical protein
LGSKPFLSANTGFPRPPLCNFMQEHAGNEQRLAASPGKNRDKFVLCLFDYL